MDGIHTGMSRIYPDATHNNTLEDGAQFVDFVMETLQRRGVVLQPYTSMKKQFETGESLQGWEVKLDRGIQKYGHLSIEIAEKSSLSINGWTPSGIYRRDNTWIYIHGNYEGFWWFQKNILISLHKNGNSHGKYPEHSWKTVQKFYMPIEDANKYGVFFARD